MVPVLYSRSIVPDTTPKQNEVKKHTQLSTLISSIDQSQTSNFLLKNYLHESDQKRKSSFSVYYVSLYTIEKEEKTSLVSDKNQPSTFSLQFW